MHQVGYDRPLAPHLNSQFILKAGRNQLQPLVAPQPSQT